jgi:hypothetical protein
MRIYFSRCSFEDFENKNDEIVDYIEKTNELNRALTESGYEIVYIKEFIPYDEIYKNIESCDCLLAFTDVFGSTWKTSEITYAHSGAGAFSKVDFRIPVFLYNLRKINGFFKSMIKRQDVYVLPKNVKSATRLINKIMSNAK